MVDGVTKPEKHVSDNQTNNVQNWELMFVLLYFLSARGW